MTTSWPDPGRYRFTNDTLARAFTFKVPGLMAAVAHDLELHTRRVDGHVKIDADSAEVEATIDLWSLEVHAPLQGLQKREAEKTMQKKVLKRKGASAVISGTVNRAEPLVLTGTLTLLGSRPRDVRIPLAMDSLTESGFAVSLSHELLQTDYGITPYKAMLGALKLKDQLRIEIDARLAR